MSRATICDRCKKVEPRKEAYAVVSTSVPKPESIDLGISGFHYNDYELCYSCRRLFQQFIENKS